MNQFEDEVHAKLPGEKILRDINFDRTEVQEAWLTAFGKLPSSECFKNLKYAMSRVASTGNSLAHPNPNPANAEAMKNVLHALCTHLTMVEVSEIIDLAS